MDGADRRQIRTGIREYDYANVEILYNVLKNAGSLDTKKLCAAADELNVDTIIGNVTIMTNITPFRTL